MGIKYYYSTITIKAALHFVQGRGLYPFIFGQKFGLWLRICVIDVLQDFQVISTAAT
ncbi:MAG: hypothetical protein VKL59_00775 [Nostocaceae cyanobacterium]|nr:hypothetical protein [Nostocaceae cyanobacterium]